jgi:flagellar motor switch protein FliG
MTTATNDSLNGFQKAAVLLINIGAELSAAVFKTLNDTEIERLTSEIGRLASVGPGTTQQVLEEFDHLAQAQSYIRQGGLEYAEQILQRAVGPKKSRELVERLRQEIQQPTAFEIVKRVDPKNLLDFIRREHPQTIALILANMDPKQAAQTLAELPGELQSDVILRIATMDKTSPEVVKQIESILEDRFSSMFSQEVSVSGGSKAVAEIMNRLDRSTEKNLISMLQEQDGQLAESIRRMMFTFEDIVQVDDRGIQKILKEIEQHDLVLALKAASSEVATKVYKNMSERASSLVKEEISFLGPVRLRDVEDAQRRIVEAVRRMEEQGEIIVQGRGGQDDIVI